jgi:uncharacterized membrane protein
MRVRLSYLLVGASAFCLACPGFGSDSGASVDNPSYTDDVKPILDGHCIKCHVVPPKNGATPGFRLDQYDDDAAGNQGAFGYRCTVKFRAVDGIPSFMPPSGEVQLNAAERDTILKWIEDGGIRNTGDPPMPNPCP